MLDVRTMLTISGSSTFDNTTAERFTALVEQDKKSPAITERIENMDLYNEHKDECLADEEAFKDYVYSMIADEQSDVTE